MMPSAPAGLLTLEQVLRDVPGLSDADLAKRFATPFLVVTSQKPVAREEGTMLQGVGSLPPEAGASTPTSPLVMPVAHRQGSRESEKRVTLGRSQLCDVVLPFASVSKMHAYLSEGAEAWELSDAWSTNGTKVDGTALAPGARAALRDGAELQLGNVLATFWLAPTFVDGLKKRAGRR